MRVPFLVAALLVTPLVGACTSVSFERETPTSGTFRSSAWSFTILSFDFPGQAVDVARANASDARQPNTVIEHEFVLPHLGPLDWLLDVISIRYARCSGTWGFPSERRAAAGATR